jgi:hypothetical protein
MNQSLAALMTCLLVGLLVALTSKTGITYAYLSLLSTCWYFSRGYGYTGVDRTGWKFTLDKWQWKGVQRQIERSRWQRQLSLLNKGMPIPASLDFQGSASFRGQCAHLGSFVPRTRVDGL